IGADVLGHRALGEKPTAVQPQDGSAATAPQVDRPQAEVGRGEVGRGEVGRGRPQPRDASRADTYPGEPQVTGKVLTVSGDGKKITLEMSSRDIREALRDRAEPRLNVEITLTDNTTHVYYQVPKDGAKPTAGYLAKVWLAEGGPNTAARVEFTPVSDERRQTLVMGKVVAVSGDGKVLTLEMTATGRDRVAETRKLDIHLTDKTQSIYNGVGKDGAKPTVGYQAQVWLEEGSENTAARVQLGPES